jgi:orotidine-5'-phosphate decarboxylase
MGLTEKETLARSMLCLPLDNQYDLNADTKPIIKHLSPYVGLFKIGKGSYTRFGHDIIKMVQDYGADVFLDLKYHDIPNTVEDASDAAAGLGIFMFNVHASGGYDMMKAALRGAEKGSERNGKRMPKVVGVTILTSLDRARFLELYGRLNPEIMDSEVISQIRKYAEMKKDDEALNKEFEEFLKKYGLENIISDQVFNLAKLAESAGLDGIVCSANEVAGMKNKLREGFMYATPGIRPVGEKSHDQKRIMTPGNAMQDGSSIIIVGRPILEAEDKPQAAYRILQEMAENL